MVATAKILSLMFHRVEDKSQNFSAKTFAKYLEYLINNFPIVMPNDSLPQKGIAVNLTFDDAYFDFYKFVFPLLQQYNIPAILAVTPKYILDNTDITEQTRLNVPYPQGMDEQTCLKKAPFCTFQELREMHNSGLVKIAAHGYKHANLADPNTNYTQEILHSKQILDEKLATSIEYFIYPFGNFTRKIHKLVKQNYQYGFRIGTAINNRWDNQRQMIYRVDAEKFWPQLKQFTSKDLAKFNRKFWLNRIRLK